VQRHGGKNWWAVAALVPGRTKKQCRNRWHDVLDPSVARTAGRNGSWTEDEDRKLASAVHTVGGNKWVAIAVLVPGRTKAQCRSRWNCISISTIDRTTAYTGKWEEDEDIKLKNAVQMHGGKSWDEIALLVPSRTKSQCWHRWQKQWP
jgi:hypothetical protein